MHVVILVVATMILAAHCHAKSPVYGDHFRSASVATYLEEATVHFASLEQSPDTQGRLLKITGSVLFNRVDVDDQIKYRLSFKGRQEGSEQIEDNPRLAELAFNTPSFLPWCELRFFDGKGEIIRERQPQWCLPFGRWHEYQWLFYPPANAVAMQWVVHVGARGNTLYLADVELAPAPNEEAININPSFEYGFVNYSGWAAFNKAGGKGRLHRTPDGQVVLDTGFSATSTRFPLSDPGTYRIHMRTSCYIRNNFVFLVLLDAQGKPVARIGNRPDHTLKATAEGPPPARDYNWYFRLPEGVERGYFLIYHNMIEELRLSRIGHEQMYEDVSK